MKKLLNIFTMLSLTVTSIGLFNNSVLEDQNVTATDVVDLTLSWQEQTEVDLPNLVNALNTIEGNSSLQNASFSLKNNETNNSINFKVSAFDASSLSFILFRPDFTFNRIELSIYDVQIMANYITAYYSFINSNGVWQDDVVVIGRFDSSSHDMSEYWTTNISFTYNVNYY